MYQRVRKNAFRTGMLLFGLAVLFPPWVQVHHFNQIRGEEPLGYALIIFPPSPKLPNARPAFNPDFTPDTQLSASPNPYSRQGISVRMDLFRLMSELIAIAALTGLAVSFSPKDEWS